MADEDDAARRGDSSLNDTHNVRNRQASEERPHGEVLETSGGGRELVAKGIVLHVDADKVVEARGREAEDARNLLGVEEVSGLVPVNPHPSKVVTEKVVQRVTGQERETVGDPVGLVRVVVEVRLGPLAQVTDGLRPLLVGAGPDSEGDAVECVRRVLLENKGVVDAVRLAASSADLDIVREASLE